MIRVLTFNIQDGGRGRAAELLTFFAARNADVVLLQEVMDPALVGELAARLEMNSYTADSNSERTMALLSRLPILDAIAFHPPLLRHTCLIAELAAPRAQTLSLCGVHLAAPAFTLLVELYRWCELYLILRQIKTRRAANMLVAGDFNALAAGDRFDLQGLPRQMRAAVVLRGGLIARQVIGLMRREGWVDCFRLLNPSKAGFTFPAERPRVRLDYMFVNHSLRGRVRNCEVASFPPGMQGLSDHLAVQVGLEM